MNSFDTPLLECKNLSKNYSYFPALKNVNLTLERGRIIGLLGPNGSGKTTLIKLINGLLTPTSGEILINGLAPSPETKARVSYLPDALALPNWKKVEAILDYYKDFYLDFDKAKALDMLARLQLNPNAKFGSLSKGMKEKVQLILTMSRDADLYCLDEPIGGVDPASRDYILKTILNNYSESASVLISTHLISDIEKVLDDVIFLKQGCVTRFSPADELRDEYNMSVDALFREEFKC